MNNTLKSIEEKLNCLDTSQICIERLSDEFIKNITEDESLSEDMIRLWKFFLINRTEKLPYIYLANDIIQNSIRKKPIIQELFFRELSEIIPILYHNSNEKFKKEIQKLIEIWDERKIYDSDKLLYLKSLLSTKISIFDNLNNPLFPYLILNKKVSISPKIAEFAISLKKLEQEKEILRSLKKEDDDSMDEKIILEYKDNINNNTVRGNVLRNSSNAIKKQNQIFFKHIFYLQEIDKILLKLEKNYNI